jgi:hypothetical protein
MRNGSMAALPRSCSTRCPAPATSIPIHNGLISVEELTTYVGDHLSRLTGGTQELGREVRFGGGIFVAGL